MKIKPFSGRNEFDPIGDIWYNFPKKKARF